MHKLNLQRTLFLPIPPRSQSLPPEPPPAPQTPDTSTQPHTTLINPLLDIPHTLPPVALIPPQQESLETYQPPEKYLYHKPLPVLQHSSNLNLFTRHIPKQKDIEDFLKILRAKVLHSYSLPLLASEIQQAYKTSSAFKNIYQYITTHMLPSNKRLQHSVLSNAENYKYKLLQMDYFSDNMKPIETNNSFADVFLSYLRCMNTLYFSIIMIPF